MDDNGKTILLVEDEAITAMMGERYLKSLGYQVVIAATGELAVELADNRPGINLILMDIDLGGGIDGTVAAARILRDHDIPVVFMSGHTEREVVAKTEAITNYGYVVKNSGITVLDASLKMAFKLFDAKQLNQAVIDRLEATLDALPDTLFEIGMDGFVHDVHSPHTGFAFAPDPDIKGSLICTVLPAEAAEPVMSALREAHALGYSRGKQFQLATPGHGACWFELSVTRKPGAAGEPRFMLLRRDITGRKQVEEDLRIHQFELKMQNDECLDQQAALDDLRAKYYQLFDLAPVGFVTLDAAGLIVEANLLASSQLGQSRSLLEKRAFAPFVHADDQDILYHHRKRLAETGNPQVCELRIIQPDGGLVPAQLRSSQLPARDGSMQAHLVLISVAQGDMS